MISFVYFDVGGVVIQDISQPNRWLDMQRDLGITPDTEARFIQFWDAHKERLDLDLDLDDLLPLLKAEFNLKLPADFSWLNDFVERFEPNYSLWPIIQPVAATVSVGLLTNMYPRMFQAIEGSGLLPPITWDVIIDSSIEGVKKPNPEIFKIAERRAHTPVEELLFVDNSQKNIAAAQALGWQTFFYDSSNYEQSSQQLQTFLSSHLTKTV